MRFATFTDDRIVRSDVSLLSTVGIVSKETDAASVGN